MDTPTHGQNVTPPVLAKRYKVASKKIVRLIEAGEIAALDLSSPGSTRPRYSISPAAIEAFEQRRQVTPTSAPIKKHPLRPRTVGIKKFF
jgi:hypothetical protein